jgi:cytidine deaminase
MARKEGRSTLVHSATATKPELFFGLVGATGTDLQKVQDNLEQTLRAVGYQPKSFRLSELLTSYTQLQRRFSPSKLEDKRIIQLMKLGDELRLQFDRGDAVALLATAAVRDFREAESGDNKKPLFGRAFIFNSLKHPAEVETLRQLYGESFFVVGCYSPTEKRLRNLRKRIAKSYMSMEEEKYTGQAREIIAIDQKRPGTDLGQNVRETFPLADVFVSSEKAGRDQIKRFVELLFGNPFITPTVDEHGMFHAKAAALRSADLSRQVGALITTKSGEFIAAGCNEVPAPGGGSFWEGAGSEDDRDFRHGRDANAVMKHEIVSEVFRLLKANGWLSKPLARKTPDYLTELALNEGGVSSFKDARVASLIEFGRIVHAEMAAISEASRRGTAVNAATLYCTTFPCHMCARHIIASGIDRVVYIEPYPKSMTRELYKFSVKVEDDSSAQPNAVRFEPFVGISPSIYFRFFSMPTRKDKKGYAVNWVAAAAAPRFVSKSHGYIANEAGFIEAIYPKLPNNTTKLARVQNAELNEAQKPIRKSTTRNAREASMAKRGDKRRSA